VEVNRAVAEPAFVQQFEVHADTVAGQRTLAASDQDRLEEHQVLVDEPSFDRLGGQRGTAPR